MEGRAAHGGIPILQLAQRSARERDPGSVSGDLQPSGRDTGSDVPDHGDQPDEPAESADAAGPDTETMPLELSGECGAMHGGGGWRGQREILAVLPVRVLGGDCGRLREPERQGAIHELRLCAHRLRSAGHVPGFRRDRVRAADHLGAHGGRQELAHLGGECERGPVQRFRADGLRHGLVCPAGGIRAQRRKPHPHGSPAGDR